jgi:MSHA biogenesis protein MshM
MTTVEGHWKLTRDPFAEVDPPFIPTPTHAEAVARLSHVIATAGRLAVVRGIAGVGKSRVLGEVARRSRGPTRRQARACRPIDGASLLATLAAGLGNPPGPAASRAQAWRALVDAARLCRLQGLAVVLAVDDAQDLVAPADRLDLERLVHVDPHPEARVTVLRAERTSGDGEPAPGEDLWGLAVRVIPLTRSEAARYVAAKLAAAGREAPVFTPHAITRLHALTGGVPRGLDRLAAVALAAGAGRGVEAITPEVVEGVAAECLTLA